MNEISAPLRKKSHGPAPATTHSRLQHVTHPIHTRLTGHPLLHGLLRPDYSLEKYKLVLAVNFHIYRAIETAIEAGLANADLTAPFSYTERRKLPWLSEDLRYFAIDPEASLYRPRRPAVLPVPNGPGEVIGLLYVVEGATKGGQVVSRELIANFGMTASSGARFFNAYGDASETARRWREFEEFAGMVRDDPEQMLAAELAAAVAFDLVEKELDDYYTRLSF
jgi:heme oxygenase